MSATRNQKPVRLNKKPPQLAMKIFSSGNPNGFPPATLQWPPVFCRLLRNNG